MGLYLKTAREMGLRREQVESVDQLLVEGNTTYFIAHYRKEVTGELDEVKLREVEENLKGATTLQQVEDIYLPFRRKRRALATVAKMNMPTTNKNRVLTKTNNQMPATRYVATVIATAISFFFLYLRVTPGTTFVPNARDKLHSLRSHLNWVLTLRGQRVYRSAFRAR